LVHKGQVHVLVVSDKVKTPPPYRVDKSVIYPTVLSSEAVAQVQEAACRAVQAVGITTGAAHVELCMTAQGPRLFELGARCGGGGIPDPIVPYVTGVEMAKEAVRLALGEAPENVAPVRSWSCVYHFLTPTPGRLRSVEGLEEVSRWPGVLDCGVVVNPGDVIRSVRTGADRAGFVIAGDPARDKALDLARRAEERIVFHREADAVSGESR
jgi:biotin carboxylase